MATVQNTTSGLHDRSAIAGLAFGAVALVHSPQLVSAAATADPVFGAIERHRQQRTFVAAAELLHTVPATLAGMLALLHYVAGSDDLLDSQPGLIATLIAALTPLAVRQ